MTAYVESNFVLELAFLREECEHCEAILDLAESASVRVAIPAFSVVEPYDTSVRRAKTRSQLLSDLVREIAELARSKPYADLGTEARGVIAVLLASTEQEKDNLDAALTRVLDCADVIPVGPATIRSAAVHQKALKLSPQDAIVYASVLDDLSSAPTGHKCFLSRDGDFAPLEAELRARDCRLIASFRQGVDFIRWALTQSGEHA